MSESQFETEDLSLSTTESTIDPGPGNQDAWRHFLKQFALCGVVSEAARAANVDRSTVYNWKWRSPRCAAEWAEAEEQAADVLRTEARRRAIEGVDKPLHYQGVVFAYERVYSDTLMGRLLQAHCPEHKQESNINVGGQPGNPVGTIGAVSNFSLDNLTAEERKTVKRLMMKAIVKPLDKEDDSE